MQFAISRFVKNIDHPAGIVVGDDAVIFFRIKTFALSVVYSGLAMEFIDAEGLRKERRSIKGDVIHNAFDDRRSCPGIVSDLL